MVISDPYAIFQNHGVKNDSRAPVHLFPIHHVLHYSDLTASRKKRIPNSFDNILTGHQPMSQYTGLNEFNSLSG